MGAYSDEELALIGSSDAAPRKPLAAVQAPAPNNDLSPLMDASGEPAAGKPSAPVPQNAPMAVNPKSPFTPEEQAMMDSVPKSPQGTGATNAGQASGSSPMDSIDESPVSPAERAVMGWVRTPEEQIKYLKSKFGDVQQVETPEGGKKLVVQDKDGKWYDADPNFHWTQSAAGFNVPQADNHNFKTALGAIAQTTGEYQLRAEAAVAGGGAAAAAALPVSGPWGAAAAGIAGSTLGAMSAEAVDLAGRKAAQMAKGEDYPGAVPYKNAQELQQQMIATALLGSSAWAGGKLLQKAVGGVAKLFGETLDTLVGTEGGRVNARKILGAMGSNEGLVEARLNNPKQTALYDEMVKQDSIKGLKTPGRIDGAEDAAFQGLSEDMQSALAREQGEFAKMQADPKVQNLKLDNSQLAQEPLNALKQSQVVAVDGRLIPMNQGGVYGEGDAKAIGYIRALANKEGAQNMSYQDVRQEVQKIGTILNGQIQNQYVRQLLTQTKSALNDSVVKGLGDETGAQYKALLSKYSTVRQTMEDLGSATAGQKKYTFINKLVNTEKRTVARDLIGGLQNAGVPFDNVEKLLQIQSARETAPFFARAPLTTVAKVPVPLPSANRVAKGVAGAYDAMKSLASPFQKEVSGSIPYTAKTLKFMKSLPDDQLKKVLTSPDLFDYMYGTAAAGYAGQKIESSQLLKKAGVE